MTGKRWTVASVLAGIAAIATLYANADSLGFNLDRPAWKSELLEYTGYSLCDARRNKRAAINRLDALIKTLQKRGVPKRDYQFLLSQRRSIADQLRDINRLLGRRVC